MLVMGYVWSGTYFYERDSTGVLSHGLWGGYVK